MMHVVAENIHIILYSALNEAISQACNWVVRCYVVTGTYTFTELVESKETVRSIQASHFERTLHRIAKVYLLPRVIGVGSSGSFQLSRYSSFYLRHIACLFHE